MAGLAAGSPTPEELTVHSKSKVLEIRFSDGANFSIPFELMRISSPSAEVQGHGPGQEILHFCGWRGDTHQLKKELKNSHHQKTESPKLSILSER